MAYGDQKYTDQRYNERRADPHYTGGFEPVTSATVVIIWAVVPWIHFMNRTLTGRRNCGS